MDRVFEVDRSPCGGIPLTLPSVNRLHAETQFEDIPHGVLYALIPDQNEARIHGIAL